MFWDMLNEMQKMSDRFNRYDNDFFGSFKNVYPKINILGSDDMLVIKIELPGVDSESLDISIVDNILTLKGSRINDEKKDQEYQRRERVFGDFERIVKLPFVVDREKIEAKMKNGILILNLPRAEATKPKKINVSAG